MEINLNEVEHVARLARIEITDQEKAQFAKQLSEVIGYIENLEEADIAGTIEISQISGLKNITRADKVTKSLSVEKVLANAPEKQENFIKTRQVFGGE